jgi:hypothetical protein
MFIQGFALGAGFNLAKSYRAIKGLCGNRVSLHISQILILLKTWYAVSN